MKRFLPLTFLLLLALCAACAPAHPGLPAQPNQPAPAPIRPAEGFGGLTGHLEGLPDTWRQQPLQLYAAPFLDDGSGQGIYMLEPDVHPSGEIGSDGVFQLNDVPPGAYVLVAGPTPEEAHLLSGGGQQTGVVNVQADQVLDLGALKVSE